MTSTKDNIVLIPWGAGYYNTYLAIPASKAAAFLDAMLQAELVEASNYTIDEKTTFEKKDLEMRTLIRLPRSRLETPPAVEETPSVVEEQDPEPFSDLEKRIGEIPQELEE